MRQDQIEAYKPPSAARWLKEYLPSVEAIYAFQLLSGTDAQNGWSAVHAVQGGIWARSGGILQADSEGFTNEEGHHILWQFSDSATGTWKMAVLENERWTVFQMDLGNIDHRKAFWEGNVPPGAQLL